jgi:hypothetical protein
MVELIHQFIRPPIPVDAQVDAQIVEPTKQPEQVQQANINPQDPHPIYIGWE